MYSNDFQCIAMISILHRQPEKCINLEEEGRGVLMQWERGVSSPHSWLLPLLSLVQLKEELKLSRPLNTKL